MRARDRKYFKKKLLEKREELISVVQKTEHYGREVDSEGEAMDIADKASSSYTKEFMFSKSDSDRQLLQTVVDALARVEEKKYGECLNCGEPVEWKRLEAVPWTSLCLGCQEQAEESG
ncbi:TraR/DksA family transcriptional regulator [Acidobacteria bacterium AH-259-D05]|nr:TraR/DksA family transcriptional regulator [Acidobacteria bacterium AH-259-D05]